MTDIANCDIERYKDLVVSIIIECSNTCVRLYGTNLDLLTETERNWFDEIAIDHPDLSISEILYCMQQKHLRYRRDRMQPVVNKLSRGFLKCLDYYSAKEFLEKGWVWDAFKDDHITYETVWEKIKKDAESKTKKGKNFYKCKVNKGGRYDKRNN